MENWDLWPTKVSGVNGNYFFMCTRIHHYKIYDALKGVQGAMNIINAGTSFEFTLGAGQEVFLMEVTLELQCESRE